MKKNNIEILCMFVCVSQQTNTKVTIKNSLGIIHSKPLYLIKKNIIHAL